MASRLNVSSNSARPLRDPDAWLDRRPTLSFVSVLLLGVMMSVVVAVTVAQTDVLFVVPLILVVPVGVLLFRYPLAAVMLWLLIFPFVVRSTSGSVIITVVYYAIHRALIPGTLWLVLIQSWAGRRTPIRVGPAEYVMGISLLWGVGSVLLLGRLPLQVLADLYDRLFVPYCMYLLIRLLVRTPEDLRRLLPVAFFTLITQAVIGILSWFFPAALPIQWQGELGERVVGTFRNPAVYTSTILFLSLLIFQFGITSRSAWARLLAMFTIGLGFFCVMISFSRGSWLGGALVLLGLTIVYPRVMLALEGVGLVLGVALGSTVMSNEINFANERLNNQETAQSRLLTGAKSLGMIDQRPLFGWGYGNYDLYDDQFRVVTSDIASIKESDATSHNTFLTIMAEQGIPALGFYLFPTGWWFFVSLAVARRMPLRGFWSLPLLILLWLLILDHLTVSSFMDMVRFNLFGTSIYWMALGLIAAMVAPIAFARPEPERGRASVTLERPRA